MAKEIGDWSKMQRGKTPPRKSTQLHRASPPSSPILEPGEKLLWTSASRFRTPDLKGPEGALMLVVGGVFAALVAMLLNALGQADLTTLIFLLLWVAGAGLGFAWTLRSYLSQVYSLTSKRVLVRSRFLPFRAAIPGSQIIQIAADNAAAIRGVIIIRYQHLGSSGIPL